MAPRPDPVNPEPKRRLQQAIPSGIAGRNVGPVQCHAEDFRITTAGGSAQKLLGDRTAGETIVRQTCIAKFVEKTPSQIRPPVQTGHGSV